MTQATYVLTSGETSGMEMVHISVYSNLLLVSNVKPFGNISITEEIMHGIIACNYAYNYAPEG